jgi:hypothetical protein
MDEILAGYKSLVFLVGGGGITTILAAWLGWRSSKKSNQQPPPTPIQVESPWMVIELNTMSNMLQELRREVQGQTTLLNTILNLLSNSQRRH